MSNEMINEKEIPELKNWEPEEKDLYFTYDDELVKAKFSEIINNNEFELFETFIINKKHYKDRMADVVAHINYYIKFYDVDKEFLLSIMSIKYMIDTRIDMSQKVFKKLILQRIITPSFITNVKRMAVELNTININTDTNNKFKSTPKITNEHARILLALSFANRLILPLCVHYSNTNTNIVMKRDYIDCFDKIFMGVLKKFEKDDINIYNPLCRFVKYRLDRCVNSDSLIWEKKKQLYGITFEYVLQNMIHEVILVKSLYKISYDRSVVSYIDGVVGNSYNHFRFENFKYKPVEIEAESGGGDNDDYMSHAESLEMSIYRIDESNQIINEINNKKVFEDIKKKLPFKITEEEYNFYYDNVRINTITQMLLHSFYSRFFKSSSSIYLLSKEETVVLLILLKKYLTVKGMSILPQIASARIKGKFKENMIKNSKFIEKFETSDVYQNIITTKFKYIQELSKEDPIIKRLSTIINSTFEFVDMDDDINGLIMDDVPIDKIMNEFLTFLSII